jgi:hypothetical protein
MTSRLGTQCRSGDSVSRVQATAQSHPASAGASSYGESKRKEGWLKCGPKRRPDTSGERKSGCQCRGTSKQTMKSCTPRDASSAEYVCIKTENMESSFPEKPETC